MFELKIITDFAAAHQLAMVSQKCEELHGHNWKIEVCLQGEKLNEAGVLIDFGQVKKHVKDIMTTLDHKFLNRLEIFENKTPPSSENIAVYIAKALESKLDNTEGIRVSRVTAWESENASAAYIF
jgi:6-pyruvoyltetrahydropterin/6-carboxytetrahydropterin synthase